jgi:hypothetical protein
LTGEQVFNIALSLMNRKPGDQVTVKYRTVVPNLLSIIQGEILAAENSTIEPNIITDLNAELSISNRSCLKVAPFGLAAQLAMNDGLDTASYFNDKYEEAKRKIPASFVQIIDVYQVGDNFG